jgi:hypothetical protein
LLGAALSLIAPAAACAASLRFFGQPLSNADRVEIRLDAPVRPVDVGGDFTLEFWLRALPGSNPVTRACTAARDEWIWGNIVVDRDVFGDGDLGDFGLSLMQGRVAFGVSLGSSGATACGTIDLRDGLWHHVAVTRASAGGQLRVFVDGLVDGSVTGPVGDVSYRDGRSTPWPFDPFLVLGNEKHFGPEAYSGWMTMLRVSNTVRYAAPFVRPSTPFVTDAATVALYPFAEGAGAVLGDTAAQAGGPSNGVIRVGGAAAGPAWSPDSPFGLAETVFADGFESLARVSDARPSD